MTIAQRLKATIMLSCYRRRVMAKSRRPVCARSQDGKATVVGLPPPGATGFPFRQLSGVSPADGTPRDWRGWRKRTAGRRRKSQYGNGRSLTVSLRHGGTPLTEISLFRSNDMPLHARGHQACQEFPHFMPCSNLTAKDKMRGSEFSQEPTAPLFSLWLCVSIAATSRQYNNEKLCHYI